MWQDAKLLLANSTTKKWLNAWQAYTSYQRAKTGKPYNLASYPVAISIEPTTACNLRCPFCISGKRDFTRQTGFLDYALFTKIVDEIHQHTLWLNYYFQGEPFLHPQSFDMLRYAVDRGLIVSTSSNGHFFQKQQSKQIVDSKLHRLIISIDGATQNSYATYRIGGDLERVIEGTKLILEARKAKGSGYPLVVWQCVVFKHNANEVYLLKKLALRLGVDRMVFKTAQVDDAEDTVWLPDKEGWSRYTKDWKPNHNLLSSCWRMWHSAVITWDGKMVPCCFDKDARHNMGNVSELSVSDVWKSDNYVSFRKTLFKSRKGIDICSSCTEGARVWIDV